MIYPRRDCVCCGTRFTPDNEQQVDCGECHIWQRDERGAEPLDFGPSAHDERRSLENYRAVARLRPKS